MKLRDKVVFITDADSASGKAAIVRLADEGAHFILNSVSEGRHIQDQLAHCESASSKAVVVHSDLCDKAAVAAVLEEASELLGTVDVLIHNNNSVEQGSVENGDEDMFLRVLHANAKSAFVCTQVVGKEMIEKQAGSIIYISSIHAEKPTGSCFAYSASKGSVKMLSREAALHLGRHGINVNVIEIGPVEGDNHTFRSDISSLYEDYEYKVPNAVMGTPEDAAHLLLYLCSEEARYINGADIRMDGGFLMHYIDFKMKRP
jgi:glucose 1-dehydrogenase